MTVIIETASIRQLSNLYEIEKECFKAEAFTMQQIAGLLTDYNSISLLAREGDQIAAFILAALYPERNALVGHILTIDVSPASRGKGIGSRLLLEMEKLLKEKGAVACHLEAREDNTVALSLYKKLGYRETGQLRNYYGSAHGLYLQKPLV